MPKFFPFKSVLKNPDAKAIGIYTATNFLGRGMSFLLLFIFTNPKYMTPADNGLLSLFNTSLVFFMPFISMGIAYSVSTDFFKLDKKEFKNLFTTGFAIALLFTLIIIVVLYIFKSQLQSNYGLLEIFIWLIPVLTFLMFCNEQLLNIIRNNNEPTRFFWAIIARIAVELSASVILVVLFAWHWKGRIAGIMLAYVLVAAYSFYYFYKKGYLIGTIKKKYIYSELVYAVPIILLQVSIFFLSSSDKFFLAKYTNDQNATVGIYSVASVVANIVGMLSTAITQYYFPKIYAALSEKKINYPAIKKSFYSFLLLMVAGTILVICSGPFLYRYFINYKYHGALSYLYLLCIGNLFWAITYFFYSFLLYYKQKKKIIFLSLASILAGWGCNWFFISKWQAMGGAIATCVSYALVLVIALLVTGNYVRQLFFKEATLQVS